jgi:hypothetical protein
VAIRAASGDRAMILLVRGGEPMVIIRDGDRADGMPVHLADPAALQASRLYLQVADGKEQEHALSLAAEALASAAPNERAALIVSGALAVFPYSLNVNRKGGVAFLEESKERCTLGAQRPSAASDAGSI